MERINYYSLVTFLVLRQQQNDLGALWQVLIDTVEENDIEEE